MRGPGILGKYRLLAELGRGGMADVYLAVSQDSVVEFTKLLVIKSLRRNQGDDGELLSMFLDEARLAARLRHPNVVQAFEIGQDGDDCYLVLEYLDGQSLHRVLARAWRSRPMPLPLHLRVMIDVLAGLDYAHELTDFDGRPLGIVHRDVSPHNVFVTYDGQVKVVDFGIAKAATATIETRTGVVKGKVTYMAPEQARGQHVDRRADVFSVGVMLWEAMSGRRMWADIPEHQVLVQLTSGQLPVSFDALAGPEPLKRICARALAVNPRDRYPTSEAMRQELEDYINAFEVRTSAAALGRFVAELFEDRRAELRALVEAQLRGQPGGPVAAMPERLLRSTASVPIAGATGSMMRGGANITGTGLRGPSSRPRATSSFTSPSSSPRDPLDTPASMLPSLRAYEAMGPGDVTAPSPSWPSDPRMTGATSAAITRPGMPPEPSSRGRVPLALAAVAAVAVGGGLWALRPSAPGRATTTHSTSTHPPASQSVASLAPEIVEVRLSASPANASIYYDDVPLPGNPYAGRFARDGTAHRVRVEAHGFRTQHLMITLDKPVVEMTLALVPEKEKPETGRDNPPPGPGRPRVPQRPPPPPPPDEIRGPRRPPGPALPAEDPWEDGKR
jgi:tRNA A-37 threonylcarbamoyl transferase component Bud32